MSFEDEKFVSLILETPSPFYARYFLKILVFICRIKRALMGLSKAITERSSG